MTTLAADAVADDHTCHGTQMNCFIQSNKGAKSRASMKTNYTWQLCVQYAMQWLQQIIQLLRVAVLQGEEGCKSSMQAGQAAR